MRSSVPEPASGGRRRRRWGRAAVAGAAVAALVVGNASVAYAAVDWQETALRDSLFAVHLSGHGTDPTSTRHMVVSAALLDWRAANGQATVDQTRTVLDQLDTAVTQKHGTVSVGTAYGYVVRGTEAALAVPALAGVPTPNLSAMLASTWGDELSADAVNRHQVTGAYQSYAYLDRLYDEQNRIFVRTSHVGQQDPVLAAAWDAKIGAATGVTLNASLETLAASPRLPAGLDIERLHDLRQSPEAYKTEAHRQVEQLYHALNVQIDESRAAAKAMSDANPVGTKVDDATARAQLEAAKAAAEARKPKIEAAGKGIEILTTLIGFFDKPAAKQVAAVGKAGITIATAISEYLPKIAGKGVAEAISSLGSVVLTGNILGAVMTLSQAFFAGPSPEQLILEEIAKVRQDIKELRTEMHKRFDAIEKTLVTVYDEMIRQFELLQGPLDDIRSRLAGIQNVLLSLDAKIDAVATSTHTALVEISMQDFNHQVETYLGYETKSGRELTNFDAYWNAVSTFFRYGNDNAAKAPLALSQGETGAAAGDLVNTIRNRSAYGSLYLLTALARDRGWAPDLPLPTVADSRYGVPNAGAWLAASRAYVGMTHQNEAMAAGGTVQRTRDLQSRGREILTTSRSFSAPVNGGTNPLYTNLLNTYRADLNAVNAEVAAIRGRVGMDGRYDPFGVAHQAPPGRVTTAAVPTTTSCGATGGGVVTAAPLLDGMPNQFHTAFTVLPEHLRPKFAVCYQAHFFNIDVYDGRVESGETAEIDVTVRVRVQWPGEDWRDVRSARASLPAGKVSWYNHKTGHSGRVTPEQVVVRDWNSGVRYAVERGVLPNVAATEDDAWLKTTWMLHGRQKEYYRSVVADLQNPYSELGRRAARLDETLMLLQAYTEVGFPKALRSNERLGGLLFGAEHLPGRFLVGAASSNHLLEAYGGALTTYATCPDGGLPCPAGQWFHPWTKAPEQYAGNCAAGPPPVTYPGDPVGNCVARAGFLRAAALAEEYQRQSTYLADGDYVEGLPEVEEVIVHLGVTHEIVTR
ncbi:hypothetical protein [Polymorphospora rubra]|uniref:Uncharacterized protein n=1 Tax=Polymorphospora rubra TaxID=338584 RepID=A0A810N8H8_9ACTN|nr:hypothetical protein [Polymorphospora rubra]BCJ68754.1 hypothetical protein Prubr_57750 [Polymorphospora rubra]